VEDRFERALYDGNVFNKINIELLILFLLNWKENQFPVLFFIVMAKNTYGDKNDSAHNNLNKAIMNQIDIIQIQKK